MIGRCGSGRATVLKPALLKLEALERRSDQRRGDALLAAEFHG
jgi:hypothetical protein